MSDRPFSVWLAWSDLALDVPAGTSVLTVLEKAGVPVEPGCLTGGCGSCVTPYVGGCVVHKDSCLSSADRERFFCPCVSRAEGTLVLPL